MNGALVATLNNAQPSFFFYSQLKTNWEYATCVHDVTQLRN